jgi:phospholipid/cholesterol/gamma-HCH transport system substrate-binding protein
MTLARGAGLGALAIAVVVVAVLLLSGDSGHLYHLRFINAGQLVTGDQVQVGGNPVGSIQSISLTNDNQADIKVSVSDPVAPLHEGTTAVIRATSLSGIANRYVALSPGANNAPAIADGGTIGTSSTQTIVDLDQVFNTLDAPTRRGLQQVIQGSATQYAGQGANANQAAKYFSPALSTTQALENELLRDQTSFTSFLVNSSRVVTAIAARQADVTNLVTNANTTATAIGDENAALDRALQLLPNTLRQGNSTFVNLRHTLDDLDPLVAASKPATKRLAPLLADLRPLVHDAVPTIHDLRTLIHRPGPNNDLIDLLNKTPGLQALAQPTFQHSVLALQQGQPIVSFVRPYVPELVGWLRDFGQGASTYDANGHYARIAPVFNAFQYNDVPGTPGTLNPLLPSQRSAGTQVGVVTRCPGAASQPPPDASAPYTDSGALTATKSCDPTLVPPGP